MKKSNISHEVISKSFENGISPREISVINKISYSTVLRILKKENYTLNVGTKKKYPLKNNKFFENIETETKAYWLGFILSDGCIRTKQKNTLTLNLALKDMVHLKKMIINFNESLPIKVNKNQTCTLNICDKILCEDLRKKGIVANNKKVYEVKEELKKHFWRGVIDGDGSLSHAKHKRKNGKIVFYPQIRIVSSENIVLAFKAYCLSLTDTNAQINKAEDKNAFRFRVKGNSALKIIEEMYKASNIFLNRKKRLYFESIQKQHECNLLS